MVAIATKPPKVASKLKVPDFLVKEEIDGIRFYYRDYKLVLNKKQNLEDIIGSNAIQSLVIQYLMSVFFEGKLQKNTIS